MQIARHRQYSSNHLRLSSALKTSQGNRIVLSICHRDTERTELNVVVE